MQLALPASGCTHTHTEREREREFNGAREKRSTRASSPHGGGLGEGGAGQKERAMMGGAEERTAYETEGDGAAVVYCLKETNNSFERLFVKVCVLGLH